MRPAVIADRGGDGVEPAMRGASGFAAVGLEAPAVGGGQRDVFPHFRTRRPLALSSPEYPGNPDPAQRSATPLDKVGQRI